MNFNNKKTIINILDFEDLICKKKGNLKNLDTTWENRDMILYIVHDVLALSDGEYYSLYSVETNKKYHLTKYITSLYQLLEQADKHDVFLGRQAKEQIFSVLYPEKFSANSRVDAIRRLSSNDESLINYLHKIKSVEKRGEVLSCYLNWLLKNIFKIETLSELYQFLARAEKIKLAEKVPALELIYQDYFCLMDFYFLTLPFEKKQRDFRYYLKNRVKIEEGLDVLEYLHLL